MAPDTTPPSGATRYLQTTRGLLSYSQLAPLLAERVLRVERDIAAAAFAGEALTPELILDQLASTHDHLAAAFRAVQ